MKTDKKSLKPVISIIIIIAIITLLFTVFSNNNKEIARVNGKSINKNEYDKEYNSIKKQIENIPEGNFNPETAEILKQDVINHLITLALIEEYAEENNITFTQEEFEQEYATRIAFLGGEEIHEDYLERYNLSEEAFRKDIENELILIKSVVHYNGGEKFVVTEEETRIAYDNLVLEVKNSNLDEEIPAYEDVKDWFVQQLENQKILEESKIFIENLKSEAKIEVLI